MLRVTTTKRWRSRRQHVCIVNHKISFSRYVKTRVVRNTMPKTIISNTCIKRKIATEYCCFMKARGMQ